MERVPIIDYELLLEIYNMQLEEFISSSFSYQNVALLSNHVMGFSNCYLCLFGEEEDENYLNANFYMLETFLEIQEGKNSILEQSLAFRNYFLTAECARFIVEKGLEGLCRELIPEMNLNTYRVGKVYQLSGKRGM